jgi:hypothetical protein
MSQVTKDELVWNRSHKGLLQDQAAQVVGIPGTSPGQDGLEVDAPLDVGPAFPPSFHEQRSQSRSLADDGSHFIRGKTMFLTALFFNFSLYFYKIIIFVDAF